MCKYEEMEISWDELKKGDIFEDGSIVEEIMDWEYRPCFTLKSKESEIVVSDEHLIKCIFKVGIDFESPIYDYNGNIIINWATSERISSEFKNGKTIYLIQENGNLEELDYIDLYQFGFPQKVRCIKTNTGEYKIGNFMNHNTTTFAACMNDFSKPGGPFENSVIISLEDPIEYIYNNSAHVKVVQKELGIDFKEYSSGIKQSLREHPNFVNVAETRDKETIAALIEGSRTGHGVFSTFHSDGVADSISRLYNQSCSDGNKDIMYDLISNINIIICQRIVANGESFKLETQYMLFTASIITFLNEMIEQDKNIPSVINSLLQNKTLLENKIVKDWG